MLLNHCVINVVEMSDEITLKGSFSIEDDKLFFWIEWDENNPLFAEFFECYSFTAHIVHDNKSGIAYTCFNCHFVNLQYTAFDRFFLKKIPVGGEKNIAVECESWIEGVCVDDLESKFWNAVCFHFDFSEPWFPDSDIDKQISVSENETLCFQVAKHTESKLFPRSVVEKFNSRIVYRTTNGKFSTKEALHVGVVLQTLLRYTSSIPLPPPSMEFLVESSEESSSNEKHLLYHGTFGIKGVSERPTTNQYWEMPDNMKSLNVESSVPKWFSFCQNRDKFNAVVNYCRSQNTTFIDERIVDLTMVFDRLSQQIVSPSMDEEAFKKFLEDVSEFGETRSSGVFSKVRIRGALHMLNSESLKGRLLAVFTDLDADLFEKGDEIDVDGSENLRKNHRAIAEYLLALRHADAHSRFVDVSKLPGEFCFSDVLEIITEANRYCIDKYAFGR